MAANIGWPATYAGGVTDVRSADIHIDKLQPGEGPEALATLARAFWPDPLFGFFAPDPLWEHHALAHGFSAFMADLESFDQSWVARAGSRVVGAAVWAPPGAMPRSRRREAMVQARMARILLTGRNRRRGIALLNAVDKVHPHEPHWYLALLGTDPLVQGRGAGGRLLGPALDQADNDGTPAYLETQKEQNLAFYARHGFAVAEEIRLAGSPPVWTMRREPR
ncbi:unannotated protein [freshwater metagenome]|uniref:Unannotated protein n=1 Tax=freshwater metagenome TaxID=449393 RepID=A0A6J7FHX3_9ZZZZ|nr:GNAT family N-acetyltransferase [Actinomycetota bacterium]